MDKLGALQPHLNGDNRRPAVGAGSSTIDSATQTIAQVPTTSSSLFAQFSSNPFFTAGFGLAALGAAAALAQRGVKTGASLLRRRLLVDVEINHQDESYQWFLAWMTRYQQRRLTSAAKPEPGLTAWERLLRRVEPRLHHFSVQTSQVGPETGRQSTHFSLVPGPGRHILRYRNAFIAVERTRETKAVDLRVGKPWETVKLTTLYSHRHVFEDLFKEAHKLAAQEKQGMLTVYTAWGSDWRPFGSAREKRPLDSVVLAAGVKERILADVKDFIASANWYKDRGIPYRRGYLLYGPPGTGKSSFIQALAGSLDYDICLLNLSERGLTDDRLNHLLMTVPPKSIILLEDVDAAFANRRVQADEHGYRGANVTFSGLLNALDGVASSSNERITFLTTNHFGRLDPALIRPGRVDLNQQLGSLTREQTERLWKRFYGERDADGAIEKQFLDTLDSLGAWTKDGNSNISPAAMQGVFLWNKDDMLGAVRMTKDLVGAFKADGQEEKHTASTQSSANA